jgi:hypothetical protein
MNHKLMYCVVKTSHVWWVIVYRQFHNYNGVIFLYCHVSDSNYRLPIDIETFLFRFIRFWWTGFYRPYSVSDFPVSITYRIKTYTSENGERVFPTVFTLREGDYIMNTWDFNSNINPMTQTTMMMWCWCVMHVQRMLKIGLYSYRGFLAKTCVWRDAPPFSKQTDRIFFYIFGGLELCVAYAFSLCHLFLWLILFYCRNHLFH